MSNETKTRDNAILILLAVLSIAMIAGFMWAFLR